MSDFQFHAISGLLFAILGTLCMEKQHYSLFASILFNTLAFLFLLIAAVEKLT